MGQTRVIWNGNFENERIQREIPQFETIRINRRLRRIQHTFRFEAHIETDRTSFVKIIRMYTQNHDDDIIARKIFPDIGTDQVNAFTHGTSCFDVAHYVAGMIKRILPNYPVDENLFALFYDHAKSIIDHIEPIKHIDFLSHDAMDEYWLNATSKYNLKQKQHFHDLLDEYVSQGPKSDFFGCNSFIKNELYNDVKFARLINSRSDTFKAIIAPYTKLIEERIFVDTFPNNFIKHHDPEWVSQRLINLLNNNKQIYETDYSSFESSFGETILQVEHHFLHHMLRNNPEILPIIQKIYEKKNILTSRLGITTTVKGTRMSGEMWTSLCNGFMNYLLVTFVAARSNISCDFIVEGDDCAVAFSGIPNYDVVERLGFRLKLNTAQHVNDISFCGIKVRSDGKPIVDIMWTLHNLAYSRRREIVDQKETRKFKFKEHLACVLLSAYYRCRYTPVLNKLFYEYIKKIDISLDMCKYYLNYWQFSKVCEHDFSDIPPPDTDDSMYAWVEQEYLIPKEQLKEIERQISDITPEEDIYVDF